MKTDLVVAGYVILDNKILLVYHKKSDLWLPVGGHIDDNETPDDAVKRETREELNLDVEILNQSDIIAEGNVINNLAIPFYVNVHQAGDHNHCCFFYICKPLNPSQLKINDELNDFAWFSEEELNDVRIPADVKNQMKKVFEIYNN